MRLVLSTAVVYGHSFNVLQQDYADPFMRFFKASEGALAVTCFFIISGFLVSASLSNSKNLKDYFSKRARRVLPGYFMCLIACVFVVGPMATTNLASYLSNSQTHAFFQMFVIGGSKGLPIFDANPIQHCVNGSLWTIRWEIACYVVFGIIGACLKSTVHRAQILLALTAGLLPFLLLSNSYHFLSDSLVMFTGLLTTFCCGSCFYFWRHQFQINTSAQIVCLVLALVFLKLHYWWLILYPLTYFIICTAYRPKVKFLFDTDKYDLSYGIYLYSFPIQQLIVMYMGRDLNPLVLFLLSMAVTSAVAFLSWTFVEKPFLKRRMFGTNNAPDLLKRVHQTVQ